MGAVIRGAVLLAAVGVALGAAATSAGQAVTDGEPSVAQLEEVRSLIAAGDSAKAEGRARALLAETETVHGAEAAPVADVLDVLVSALVRGGRATAPETRELARRALAIRELTLGPDHPELASNLSDLALLLRASGEHGEARSLVERALELQEKALGPDHPEVASTLNKLALLMWEMGDYGAARPLYDRALAIHERTLGPEDPQWAATLNNLGLLLEDMGDYGESRVLYERVLAIFEKVYGPDRPEVATVLNNLGMLAVKTDGPEAGRPFLERALAIRESALGPLHPLVAQSLNNLSILLRHAGDRRRSRRLQERALAIRKEALGPDHPGVAVSLNNLAKLLEEGGDPAGALRLLERALEIQEHALGPGHPHVAVSLDSLGRVHADLGHAAAARPLLERAVEIRKQSFGPRHRLLAPPLNHLARAHWMLGDAERALALSLQAEEISREHTSLTIGTLAENQALQYTGVRSIGADLGLSISVRAPTPESVRPVWDAVIRSRAMVLDEVARRRRLATRADDPELDAAWRRFAAARQRLANLYVRGAERLPAETFRRLLGEAQREKEEAEVALARGSIDFRRRRLDSRSGFAEVAAALPPGSALLAYVAYDRQSPERPAAEPALAAFVLAGGDRAPRLVDLGPAKVVEARIRSWRDQATRYSESRYRQAAERLRQAVWDPVAPLVAGAGQVFVVPDGELHLVSFATLPAGPGRYLVEEPAVLHYLSAERDLLRRPDREPGAGLLVIGAADYDAPPASSVGAARAAASVASRRSTCGDFRSMRFEALAAAGGEIDEVSAIWRSGQPNRRVLRLTGAGAREAAFKTSAPGLRVLHLATHGFFLGERCSSASSAGDSPRRRPGGFGERESPLLLSGLALAGANRRRQAAHEDDGILTAEEIALLDLAGVEWVVLSACDTAAGGIAAGEGVFGLRRAFRIAGARTLIMSLWEVDDRATREWMGALYRARWLRGEPTAEAVRRASLEILRRRRRAGESTHPFFWGGFVAEGSRDGPRPAASAPTARPGAR